MKSLSQLLLALGFLALVACAQDNNQSTGSDGGLTPQDNRPVISVMTYNVENLFDTTQDADREDFTRLPLEFKKNNPKLKEECMKMSGFYQEECLTLDWNENVLNEKLHRLADTIISANGVGPDIIVLQEVENLNVLKMLQEKLGKKIYKTAVLIEGQDVRGIDVGLISKFPLARGKVAKLHNIPFNPPGKDQANWKPRTRGILEVPLKLPRGGEVVVFGFHFPSQSNPTWQRLDAVNKLNQLLAKHNGSKDLVIAAGDSNIVKKENISHGLQTKVLAEQWGVSHLLGIRCNRCEGSQYHAPAKSWDFLDVLLFNKSLMPGGKGAYELKLSSLKVVNTGKYQAYSDTGFPARFDEKKALGVADHFPLYAELAYKEKKK